MSNHSLVTRAWAVRAVYGLLLLVLLYYFQYKTSEQERIHHAVTGGLPQAAAAVEKANQLCFQEMKEMVESYPIDRHRDYLGIASSVWNYTTTCSAFLSGIAELPGKKERSRAFRKAVPDLIAMRDTLIAACDKDHACDQILKEMVPAADDAYWKAAAQLDAMHQADMLRLQTALASSVAMQYRYATVRGSETGGGWGGSPGIMNLQIFPAVGEWYEAGFFLSEYFSFPTSIRFRFKINGKPYPEKDGAVRYQQRFTRPGKHRLQVEIDVLATRDSTVLATSTQDFEINVLPRPLNSDSLKSN